MTSAIKATGLTVEFRPFVDRTPTFRRSIRQLRHRSAESVLALHEVSFEVRQGEAYGVIGRNGAGKSTLLRVLAGTILPDSGYLQINGSASALLRLGLGFNPELSGRHNIFLGGLAGGLSRSEVESIVDSVIDYASLGSAIDRPVKTYSSGMFARLAFAVGIHLDPDILLLDEVLTVGDEAFRAKSLDTMRKLLERSRTIVLVSHSLPRVAEFCDRAMWLDDGKVVTIGESDEVIKRYREWIQSQQERTS